MKIDPNDAAFPSEVADNRDDKRRGLTKREWMATMCLERSASPTWSKTGPFDQRVYDNSALHAVKQADALIAALDAEQKEKG